MNIIQNNRGTILVFVALGLLLLLMFLGLATDTAWTVYVRSQGQARVDAAALAAASALVDQDSTNRENQATTLANTFSDRNTVINDPANEVTPMKYDLLVPHDLTEAPNWTPGLIGDECNAVRVATTVPTPLFFSGVRNVFGASETGLTDIHVNAVAHLPCPGVGYLSEGGFAPIALRAAAFTTVSDCENPFNISLFTTYNLPITSCSDLVSGNISTLDADVEVGDAINLIDIGQPEGIACLTALLGTDQFLYCNTLLGNPNRCGDPPDPRCTVRVPIVDGGASSGNVVGFATICFTGLQEIPIRFEASLECNEYAGNTGGSGGVCLGTYTRSPILVR